MSRTSIRKTAATVAILTLLLTCTSTVSSAQNNDVSLDDSDSSEETTTDLDSGSAFIGVEEGPNGDRVIVGVDEVRTGGRNSRSVPSDLDCVSTTAIENDLVQPAYGRLGDYALDETTNTVRENIPLYGNAPEVGVDSKGRIDAETVLDVLAVRPSDERLYSPTGQWNYLSCVRDDGTLVFDLLPVGGPAVSLYDLLLQGLTAIDPPIHDFTVNPVGKQAVQFRSLFWVDQQYWNTDRSTTVGNGNVSLSVALVPYESEWDPGDGSDPIICDGPGEVWERGMKGETFDCKHTYRTVKGQPFTFTSTIRFEIQWSSNSSEVLGPFSPLTRVDTTEVGVREIQIVESNA